MTGRIGGLAAGQAIIGGGALALATRSHGAESLTSWAFVGYTLVLVALTLLPPIYVELRRHGSWITPADSATIIGLLLLGPVAFVAAVALSELAVLARVRQAPLKRLFNLVTMISGSAAGAAVFAWIGQADPRVATSWAAALAALLVIAAWDALVGSAVLAISEGTGWLETLHRLAPAVALSLVISAALGLSALLLFIERPLSVVLLAPVLAVLHASTRTLSRQHAERHRFQQLYQASGNLSQLVVPQEMLALVAEEARRLGTGAAAVAVLVEDDGGATGIITNDDGSADLDPIAVEQLVSLIGHRDQGLATSTSLQPELAASLAPAMHVVWAQRPADDDGRLVIAVTREFALDGNDDHRSAVLAAFVAHAATAVANVRLHEDVRQALAREQQLNQQKSEFVAAVSHELRTPLASVTGILQTLRRHRAHLLASDQGELIDMGLDQGSRLRRLIEDLLVVAATDHHTIGVEQVPVEIGPLLRDLEREFQPGFEGRLRTDLPLTPPTAVTDADKLRRIVANLLENARKYAPEGDVLLEAEAGSGRLIIRVSDHGPGIPEAQRERIFERFVQLDQSTTRSQGGTGLGLHLCRQLAELLGAALSVEGADGEGARFVLELPLDGRGTAVEDRHLTHRNGSTIRTNPMRARPRTKASAGTTGERHDG
ncbi:MAG: HAMP domain-containing sensor histidine kinase [Nitriliruptoraceae bacterium]